MEIWQKYGMGKIVYIVKIRPFRYGNHLLLLLSENLFHTLKSDRFGMEIQNIPLFHRNNILRLLKSDRFGMEISLITITFVNITKLKLDCYSYVLKEIMQG